MALYNKNVISLMKSSLLITHREKLFDYLKSNEAVIEYDLDQIEN